MGYGEAKDAFELAAIRWAEAKKNQNKGLESPGDPITNVNSRDSDESEQVET